MTSLPAERLFLVIMILGVVPSVYAGLVPPSRSAATDSISVIAEKGVQLTRSTESAGLIREAPFSSLAAARFRWKTEWQTPQGDAGHVRQDGRWYIGTSKRVAKPLDLWLAAQGEHFDDRPRPSSSADRVPSSWRSTPRAIPRDQALARNPAAGLNSVRILRGGVGATFVPRQPIQLNAAFGPVQDRRYGQERNGTGVWAGLTAEKWEVQGYEQNLSLNFSNEAPQDLHNRDFGWDYSISREFFAGHSNRAESSGSLVKREFLLDASGKESHRTENRYGLRDVLTYGVSRGLRVEMKGELMGKRTEQSQQNSSQSLLEENQVGFGAALDGRSGSVAGKLEANFQSVSQTIRGDIHQGRKTQIGVQGELPFLAQSRVALRFGVTKYLLDTRSARKDDDRDELRYAAEAMWFRRLWDATLIEWRAITRLDHLVYLYQQSSANNRWTRFFLTGIAVHFRPVRSIHNRLRADVSANYQDYDFETVSRSTRSNVHRFFLVEDSLSTQIGRWWLGGQGRRKIEEFGRLFWGAFEQERSDETYSTLAAIAITYQVYRRWEFGGGYLWDSRKAVRFPDPSNSAGTVLQNVRSYGPTFLLRNSSGRESSTMFLLSLQGRALRQLQLERDDRWLITGELAGSLRW